jgi:hypothetical protein
MVSPKIFLIVLLASGDPHPHDKGRGDFKKGLFVYGCIEFLVNFTLFYWR